MLAIKAVKTVSKNNLASLKVMETQPGYGSFHANINEVFSRVRNHDVVNRIVNFAADNEMAQVLVHVLRQEGGKRCENPDHGVEDGEKGILESDLNMMYCRCYEGLKST